MPNNKLCTNALLHRRIVISNRIRGCFSQREYSEHSVTWRIIPNAYVIEILNVINCQKP